jgi:hypothetical protein
MESRASRLNLIEESNDTAYRRDEPTEAVNVEAGAFFYGSAGVRGAG